MCISRRGKRIRGPSGKVNLPRAPRCAGEGLKHGDYGWGVSVAKDGVEDVRLGRKESVAWKRGVGKVWCRCLGRDEGSDGGNIRWPIDRAPSDSSSVCQKHRMYPKLPGTSQGRSSFCIFKL